MQVAGTGLGKSLQMHSSCASAACMPSPCRVEVHQDRSVCVSQHGIEGGEALSLGNHAAPCRCMPATLQHTQYSTAANGLIGPVGDWSAGQRQSLV